MEHPRRHRISADEYYRMGEHNLFDPDARTELIEGVIIDMPPLLKETASVFVVPHVDRLYLVTEAGKTKLTQVARCLLTVRQAGGQLNGVIVNKQKTPLWSRLFWREFFY